MISTKLLDTLNEQFTQLLGDSPHKTQEELRQGVQRVLQSGLARLDLVTREEFDAQSEVLARTRTLVEQLEARIATLEQGQNDGD